MLLIIKCSVINVLFKQTENSDVDEIYVEKGFDAAVIEQLKAMGYKVNIRGQIGRTEVIKVLPNKKFEAIADNRGDDGAEGY